MLWGIVTSEEFDKKNQILVKQLKNRYSDIGVLPTFKIGVNKGKMKVFDLVDNNNQDLSFTRPDLVKEEDDAELNMFSNRFTRNRTAVGNQFKFGK